TGGISYPLTGSDGDGMRFAEKLGHTVIPCRGSLVPIEARDRALCAEMMGLSLKNVALKIEDGGKKPLYEDFGKCCSRTSVSADQWYFPQART
ncbi:MAG: NAD(P)/FAD-dependent oxidoreductase, partial [Clostridia bacterium]|nr:NAD(P)/FAD-dependent oxidoreductase [Clostridia bacterium]